MKSMKNVAEHKEYAENMEFTSFLQANQGM